MAREEKYFLFNRETDFLRGSLENLRWNAGRLEPLDPGRRSVYLSPLLDSGEKHTVWHRARLAPGPGREVPRAVFYAADSRRFRYQGRETDLEAFLRDERYSIRERREATETFLAPSPPEAADRLLHGAAGRYLWFWLEWPGGDASVTEVRISLPARSWTAFLPEAYREEAQSADFLDRFLGIFQSLHDDLDAEIRGISRRFDVDAPDAFLWYLADWVGIRDAWLWEGEKLRNLLRAWMRVCRMRGTRAAASELVALYTGERPWIVERCQLLQLVADEAWNRRLQSLYGSSPWTVTVVVREACVPTARERGALRRILRDAVPAHAEPNLVVLKPYIFLDRYSYLGMNSVLGQYRPMGLDGLSAVSLTNVAESAEFPGGRKDETP